MTPTAVLISYAIATACERLAHKLGVFISHAEARVFPPPAHNLPPPAATVSRRRAFRRTA